MTQAQVQQPKALNDPSSSSPAADGIESITTGSWAIVWSRGRPEFTEIRSNSMEPGYAYLAKTSINKGFIKRIPLEVRKGY